MTKRFLKGLILKPEGWPEGYSILKGTLQSFKTLRLCPEFWNDKLLQDLQETSSQKTLYVIRSISELNDFVEKFGNAE